MYTVTSYMQVESTLLSSRVYNIALLPKKFYVSYGQVIMNSMAEGRQCSICHTSYDWF